MQVEFLKVVTVSMLFLSRKVVDGSGINTECSFRKSLQECLCVYKKHATSVFPILNADCSGMGVEQIPKINYVEDLDVSHNLIDTLDPSKISFVSSKIRTLRMPFNSLYLIHQDFFGYMPNLIELDLSNNELVKFTNSLVFSTLAKLEVLNLSHNKISTLPENVFGNLRNLKELDLSYNYLGSLFNNNKNLFNSTLGLTNSVRVLKLDGLGISNISSNFFDGASNLEYVSLVNNPLIKIPHFPNTLTHLDISGSDISEIFPEELVYPSLKILKMNRLMKLENVAVNTFQNLKMLEELHFNECQRLKHLNFPLFAGDVKRPVKKLYASKNGLHTLSSNFLEVFQNMEYVDLQNNPWTCDCDILWLRRLNMTQAQGENLRCATPNNLFNQKVIELTEADVPNCFNESNYYQTIIIAVLCSSVGILAALIVYLIYLGPLYYKNKYRNIGPESPYNGNTSCESSVMDHEPTVLN